MPSHSYFDDGHQDASPVDAGLRIDHLRDAIQTNQISFPVPAPIFSCEYRADVQWRLAELYFVRGWEPMRLAKRYRITSARVRQSLRSWVRRAAKHGYLQPIPADGEHVPHLTPDASSAWFPGDRLGAPENLAVAFAPMPQTLQPHI